MIHLLRQVVVGYLDNHLLSEYPTTTCRLFRRFSSYSKSIIIYCDIKKQKYKNISLKIKTIHDYKKTN